MATPLQYGDPPRLGPYAVQARLRALPTGFVYLAQDAGGRPVSVALLTRGAALDAAARERFLDAARQAAPARGGVRGWVARARGRAPAGAPQVIALDDGPAPWVAVPYAPGGPGAEWFLTSVLITGTLIGEIHGPDFVPYWLGDRVPAIPLPPPPAPPPTETRRAVLVAMSALVVLVVLTGVIAWLLLGRGEELPPPTRPLPPTMFVPTPPPQPSPNDTLKPSPSPSPGDSGTAPPRPTLPGDEDSGDPI
ncbi:hypothetical protein [Sphaerisporangium sp. TRM90804]|uniref:hypothetical protein n=1 Tax=Sphaerisporangium sp. TRM90804 TaxID=3031113 RepID=UPI002449133D|nr:hypothetical protein [Sphaerisporangium sp. TRM90804]MDH2430563.1 hypothetical protein [Sphaerisporangium sp. TRM90804]